MSTFRAFFFGRTFENNSRHFPYPQPTQTFIKIHVRLEQNKLDAAAVKPTRVSTDASFTLIESFTSGAACFEKVCCSKEWLVYSLASPILFACANLRYHTKRSCRKWTTTIDICNDCGPPSVYRSRIDGQKCVPAICQALGSSAATPRQPFRY